MTSPGPPIDGFTDLVREVQALRRDVNRIMLNNTRTIPLGTSYRMEVQGSGGAETVHLIRSSDGNDKLVAP